MKKLKRVGSAGVAAGYSGTPLIKKLGFPAGARVHLINGPDHYQELLGAGAAQIDLGLGEPPFDFVHLFSTQLSELQHRLPILRKEVTDKVILWVSWPKKSSSVASDITDQMIRHIALPLGFVDTKVCAVDQTWSGLKLMVRRSERRSELPVGKRAR